MKLVQPEDPLDIEAAFRVILERLHKLDANVTTIMHCCRHCHAAQSSEDRLRESAQALASIKSKEANQ